jgi:hypothetical protein
VIVCYPLWLAAAHARDSESHILNGAMEFTKWLTMVSSTTGKRFLLALIGVIAYSALNGTPLDVNSVSSIAQVLLTTAGAFLAAHDSYSLITCKTQG